MKADYFKDSGEAITVKALCTSFKQLDVLHGIELSVQKGRLFALLGQNGAGKTTTIRVLSTLLKPDSGIVRVMGYDVLKQPEEVRKVISLTGQYAAIDELLTGSENMLMMGRLYHLAHADARRRTAELLGQFELAAAAERVVKTYSGGMRRRLDLAISLIAAPSVLFLDEPTTGLDPHSRLTLWQMIRDLVDSGVTVFLTTQYLEEADRLADQIAVLHSGRIIAQGTPQDLKRRVGMERLELTFARIHEFEKARDLLNLPVVQFDRQKRLISVPINDGPRHIKQILDQVEQAAVEPDGISLRKPTLEDVFLSLTGRSESGLPTPGGK